MTLLSKFVAALIVASAFLLISHEGVIDTTWAHQVLTDAARLTARAQGE